MKRNIFRLGFHGILAMLAVVTMVGVGWANGPEGNLNQQLRVRSVDMGNDAMGNKVTRAFYEYVPIEYICNLGAVMVFVPNNTDPGEFLANSGWKKIAEEQSLEMPTAIILVTPAKNLTWNVTNPADDLAYLSKVFSTINVRTTYYSLRGPSGKFIIGYGEDASTLAQMFAFNYPADFSGVAVVNGNSNPALTADYLKTIGNTPYVVTYDARYGSKTYNQLGEIDIPTPVWIINNGPIHNTPLVDHWKRKNQAYEAVHLGHWDWENERHHGLRPDPYLMGWTHIFESEKNPIHRVILTESPAAKAYNYDLASKIYHEFFVKARRWRIAPYLEFLEGFPVREMGIQPYDLTDVIAAGAGKNLTYKNLPAYIKVPKSYSHHGPGVPLVFELHGVDNDPRVLAEQSGFWQVADKYGFIVVTPSASAYSPPLMCNRWNGNGDTSMNNDEAFLLDLLEDIATKYNIDRSRVYITGFSNGGGMTGRMTLLHTDKFAGVVHYAGSGISQETYHAAPLDMYGYKIPVWIFRGELNGAGLDDTALQEYWKTRNGITAAPTSESDPSSYFWYPGGYLIYNTDIYSSSPKSPEKLEVRRTWVTEMAHTTTPEESWMVWEHFFSRYSRNAEGLIETHGRHDHFEGHHHD